MSNYEFDNKTIGVGIVFDGPQVAIYADHQFTLGVDANVARTIARRMLEMADLIDPPKKEEPPKDPAPAVEGAHSPPELDGIGGRGIPGAGDRP